MNREGRKLGNYMKEHT